MEFNKINVFNIVFPLLKQINLLLIHIEARDRKSRFAERKHQRQTHVTEADNADISVF